MYSYMPSGERSRDLENYFVKFRVLIQIKQKWWMFIMKTNTRPRINVLFNFPWRFLLKKCDNFLCKCLQKTISWKYILNTMNYSKLYRKLSRIIENLLKFGYFLIFDGSIKTNLFLSKTHFLINITLTWYF